jgi:hypothetical protein
MVAAPDAVPPGRIVGLLEERDLEDSAMAPCYDVDRSFEARNMLTEK